jgi:hypothetical protein
VGLVALERTVLDIVFKVGVKGKPTKKPPCRGLVVFKRYRLTNKVFKLLLKEEFKGHVPKTLAVTAPLAALRAAAGLIPHFL